MNAKHTPGPWEAIEVCPNDWGVYFETTDSEVDLTICHVCNESAWNPQIESGYAAANAALIAAAPDLLAALEAICSDHDFCGDEWGNRRDAWIETARAAIAKATGGQS